MDKQQRAQATLTAHQSTRMTQTPAKPFSTPMTALCASHKAITARTEGHSIPHPAYSERPFCHCIYPAPVMVRDPQHRKTSSAMSGQSERKETGLEGTLGALPHGPHSEHNKLCSNYPQQMFIQFALKQSEKCPQVPGVRQGLVTFSLGPSLLFNPLLFPVGTESHTAPAVVLRHMELLEPEKPESMESNCSYSAATATTTNFHTQTFTFPFPHTQEVTRFL